MRLGIAKPIEEVIAEGTVPKIDAAASASGDVPMDKRNEVKFWANLNFIQVCIGRKGPLQTLKLY